MIVPYGAYACADGSVMLAIQTDREWLRFCADVMGDGSLARDARYATNALRLSNRVQLEAAIESRFAALTRAEVLGMLEAADIATAAVNGVPEVAAHAQLEARGRWCEVDSPFGMIPALLPPHNLAHAAPNMGRVPALGEHTEEVLRALRSQ
jgi:itaconate CoA-transferase